MNDTNTRKLGLVRYGLMAIPIVAWAIAFGYLFLANNSVNNDVISTAVIPSLIILAVVAVICVGVFFGYRALVIGNSTTSATTTTTEPKQ